MAPGQRPQATEYAAALVRALADDTHLHRLRVGAWETAQRFTPEAHLHSLVEVFTDVANRQPYSPVGMP